MTLSKPVLLPVFNEIGTVEDVVDLVLLSSPGFEIELLCVDDCTTDGSTRILGRLAVVRNGRL